ncbi:phosphate signaling complex protein PhoU [Halalkalibacter nanhaiisediminis]|uniref:Phosphate-specific transport system accessory protein PhoU n=1 Tax=Halalkalibacter nanhaiisediminis TaxID=688079 RepID=A0A562QK74_9BACI|nr:phosphate signaling complex protein PhoU [Halalkalibacter nanhaiisediminis]TWI57124.1 phosphate uptake regulator, PhoU [Halalkalibacter nanhaiisediminis]
MVVRSFHFQLENVKQELLEMGGQVEAVLNEMMSGFTSSNTALMENIIKNDYKINQAELTLHDKVTLLISKQQPVATDLRKLIVVLKISSDLERVADLAVDMAKQSSRLKNHSLIPFKDRLVTMFTLAQEMIRKSLESFEQSDIMLAQKIASMDDKVDTMYGDLIRDLFKSNPDQIEVDQVTQLAFIGRYIERIADYATNIAEWVVYEVNGKHFDLN